eukprot:m.55775 g.55775  ORF g.55775 m.55775 type:complete len:723 (+) comp7771_c0_seq1:40-2208(+)
MTVLVVGFVGVVILLVASLSVAEKTVHVIQTCHLDVGFADTAAGELDNYRRYLVEAQLISETLNQTLKHPNGAGLIFTTHPYIVSLLLDCPPGMGFACPNDTERDIIVTGLKKGNIVMQAFPHNAETATLTPSFFMDALQLGKDLASMLNISAPTVMSQRDVPGATIGMVPLLSRNGIVGFSVGVNTASLPPAAPRVFVWRHQETDTEILASIHPHGYGGIDSTDCIEVEGFDHILCPDYKGDNAGPWGVADILDHWAQLEKEYPNATIIPSTYDTYFSLLASVKDQLPVITQEIGDTWIYGIASDPLKNTQYRAMLRARDKCVFDGKCSTLDPVFKNFTRLLLKNPEHTWGGDVKTYLHDTTNWLNDDFHKLQYSAPNFLKITSMWQEQRDWGLTYPVDALRPASHPLLKYISDELKGTVPLLPDVSGYTPIANMSQSLQVGGFTVAFNVTNGAISSLIDGSGRQWSGPSNNLGAYEYKIHASQEYTDFFNEYAQRINGQIPSYFPLDFGKPGLYNNSIIANQTVSTAPISKLYLKGNEGSVVLCLVPNDVTRMTETFGSPQQVWIEYIFTSGSNVNVSVILFNKTATRLPESAWFSFNPLLKNPSSAWTMNKVMDETINPLNVIINGSSHLHAVNKGVSHADSNLAIGTMDAPLVSWGLTSPFPTPSGQWQPDLTNGVHFDLIDNIWGTNYIMWVPFRQDEHSYKFRFQIDFNQEQHHKF